MGSGPPTRRHAARLQRAADVTSRPDPVTEQPPPDSEARLTAIIADDDPFARRMIKDSLQRAGIVVIAEANDGREAVELCRYYRPGVLLMDVMMPGLDGIAATRQIAADMPDQLIVILTSGDDDEMGLLGLQAGAAGFLSKDVDLEALPRILRGVSIGEGAVSRRLTMRLVSQLQRSAESAKGMRPVKSPLTPREWEVVDLLYENKTTDEIADALFVTRETVRSHVKNILRKLDARTRGEAVDAAQRMRGGESRDGAA
jgi:two-component system, NarL family, response regulator LiaR